jgi:tRNA/rRNA methyltransferase
MMKAKAESDKRLRCKEVALPDTPVHADIVRAASRAIPPAIILVKPQLGENIGFAARAMANFGLNDLRLVAPRDGWPNDKARAAAAGGAFLVDCATVYATIEEAIGDLNFVLATTARPREMVKLVLSTESAASALAQRARAAERTGILFGPERSGLDNDAVALADAILTAPVASDYASLSLPHAVLLVGYEWLKSQSSEALGRVTAFDGPAREGLAMLDTRPATRAELFGLFKHLEDELDWSGFLRPPEKRASMVRSIRNMFHRMGATQQDIRTWRGIVASLARRRRNQGNRGS